MFRDLRRLERNEICALLSSGQRPDRLLAALRGRMTPEALQRLSAGDYGRRYREIGGILNRQPSDEQGMMMADLLTILPDKFFRKVDRATMAHGVEARVPFMDPGLVNFCLGLPARWLVSARRSKTLFRESQRERLPARIVARPKQGFGTPVAAWLKRGEMPDFCRDACADRIVRDYGIIDAEGAPATDGVMAHRLLMLALWLREYRPRVD